MLLYIFKIIIVYLLLVSVQISSFASDIIKEKIYIKMQDGIELAAHKYFEQNTKKLPVILIRSPYGKEQYFIIAKKLAENEYIVISQDVRGTGESEGVYLPFVNEARDGLETLEWIKDQQWYNGKIGMWGASYNAFCASVLAVQNTDLINSIFNISGGINLQKSLTPGGAFHLMMNMTWLHFSKKFQDTTLDKYKPIELMNTIPLMDAFKLIKADQDIQAVGKLMFSNESFNFNHNTSYLHMTGWYDFFNILTFDEFNRTANTEGKYNKIIVGPWCHDQVYKKVSKAGDEDFGSEAVLGINKLTEIILEWFDFSIKGKQNSLSDQKNVKLFVMGKNEWEEYDSFSPPGSLQKYLYLTSSGKANSKDGDGRLVNTFSEQTLNDSFEFDPLNPVPTLGGALFHFYPELLGVRNQSEIEKRNDVLIYTTDILNEKMKIIGEVKAELYVSTEGLNTDFTAKLVEIRKDGYAKILSDGIIRMAKPFGSKLTPGKIYKVEIDLGYTAIEIAKGNRIRLEISSSNFPKYDRNPNTGDDPLFASEFKKVKQTLYHGKEYASKLIFTVLN